MTRPRPFVLVVLDGWGIGPAGPGNAVTTARTPNMDRLVEEFGQIELVCSGESVGLPEGQMGNSEVGHLNLGAGRIVYQDFTRINRAIHDGSFFRNEVLRSAIVQGKADGRAVHLLGLVSDGGVHSHMDHIVALLELAAAGGVHEVYVHAFLDGRDTPPRSAVGYLETLEREMEKIGVGRIASVAGRYYAMDRDRRWERTEKAYDALVERRGLHAETAVAAVTEAYARGENDEFVLPTVVAGGRGISDADGVVFFNFRPDRARQITKALTEPGFDSFSRATVPRDLRFVCLTEYDATFDLPTAFPPVSLDNLLPDVLSAAGLRQLRIAETEKYAHVTFFFNGGDETPRPQEDRILVPSPAVPTYDLKPEMSACEVADRLEALLSEDTYDFVLVNFANPDMVGHTGMFDAAVRAVCVVDASVGRIVARTLALGGEAIITADHGNAEHMLGSDGVHTAHTANVVPFVYASRRDISYRFDQGILADVAPTVLMALGLPVPAEMTGRSLVNIRE